MRDNVFKNLILLLILLASTIGIVLDIHVNSNGNDLLKGLSIFKYFTLQSNAIILGYSFIILLNSSLSRSKFIKFILGPATAYILLTGVVYLIILEPIYLNVGVKRITSATLHYVTPPLMLLFWAFFETKRYSYKEIYKWMIYPFLYLIWGLYRAIFYDDFLYPFFDITKYGLLIIPYIIVVTIGFLFMSGALIFINNLVKRK